MDLYNFNRCIGLQADLSYDMDFLSQEEKVMIMDQFILNLMDYTEQSSEEKLWCDLLKAYRILVDKYGIKLKGYNTPLDVPDERARIF